MYAVEKISSYITRGVYTVSAPFHPFGGAVDIIVVQQQDGSFKSSPWYVRFGKFQGVLKAREKVVNICVNGVDAGFHMYLDHKGEAFFLKECDSQEVGEFVITPPSSGDEMDDTMRNVMFKKVHSCNYDAEGKPIVSIENGNAKIVTRTTSRRAQLLGLMFGRRSMKESEKGGDVERVNSIERAKIAADLLETRWSTNLPSNDYRDDHSIENSDFVVSNDGNKIVSSPEKSKDDKLETSVDLNSCLRTDTSKEESVGFSGEKLEDTPKQNIIRGVHFEKIITNTSSLDTSDFSDRSEVISESVMTESDEYNLLPKESIIDHFPHDAQILVSTELSDGREVGSFSHVETSGSSPMIFDVTTQTHKTVINEQLNEVTSVSEIDKAKEIEFCRDEESFISNGQCEVNLEICSLPNRLKISKDESRFPSSENFDEEQFQFSDIDSFSVKEIKHEVSVISPGAKIDDIEAHESEYPNQEECIERISEVSAIHSSPLAIPRSRKHLGETEYLDGNYGDIDLLAKSLPIIRSEVHDIERSNLLHPLSCSLHLNSEKYKDLIQKEISSSLKLETGAEGKKDISDAVDFKEERGYNASPIKSAVELSLSKDLLFEDMGAGTASRIFDAEKEIIFEPQGTNAVNHDEMNFNGVDASGAIVSSGGSWKIWPFSLKKSKTISTVRSPPESITGEEENADAAPIRSQSMTDHDDIQRAKFIRKQIKSLTPTSEELASLNLKEGRNVITFSFSTAMLGQQQVDARVYLWKWNTRIVISDVDGTITKSDVLGQFMPLVGKDWSQTGVAHLFSAIKENGYQMLFLSARAISQAYLTRQFLFNLKQDGKALPDGPVVISPDGLFPSLYREVIRRAPHEFKIKCLEDIRALFPPDCSPFYAGFGNRDTDEISYLKVGVPKGKIFIINPKGEVAVNHRVDTKSYTSLHALVNGMFPPMSTAEQEDFNSWNFWKLPVPDFEILKDK